MAETGRFVQFDCPILIWFGTHLNTNSSPIHQIFMDKSRFIIFLPVQFRRLNINIIAVLFFSDTDDEILAIFKMNAISSNKRASNSIDTRLPGVTG